MLGGYVGCSRAATSPAGLMVMGASIDGRMFRLAHLQDARSTLGLRKPVTMFGRDNKSLNRSGISGLRIRKTRRLLDIVRRPVNSTVGRLNLNSQTKLAGLVVAGFDA